MKTVKFKDVLGYVYDIAEEDLGTFERERRKMLNASILFKIGALVLILVLAWR